MDTAAETEAETVALMTPKEAAEYASTWGSAMISNDPGACMYNFDEHFLLESEEHRRQVLHYLDSHCVPEVEHNREWFDKMYDGADLELKQLARFRATVEGAPVAGNESVQLYEAANDFAKAYIDAALFTGVELPEGHPDGDSDKLYDLHVAWVEPRAIKSMIADCRRFQTKYADLIAAADATGQIKMGDCKTATERAGHDFWMTRNGHGVGFWDGDWPEPHGDQLTKAAKRYREYDLYTGDDGRVYGQNN